MNDISRINRIEDLYQEISESIGLVKIDHCQKNLESLAMSLDKFFSGTHCDRVIFTYNPDKLFFGLNAMPIIDADDIIRTIQSMSALTMLWAEHANWQKKNAPITTEMAFTRKEAIVEYHSIDLEAVMATRLNGGMTLCGIRPLSTVKPS